MNSEVSFFILSQMLEDSENEFVYQDKLNLISTSFIDDTDIEDSDADILNEVYDNDSFYKEKLNLSRKNIAQMHMNTKKVNATSQTNCQNIKTKRKEFKSKEERIKGQNIKETKSLDYIVCKNYPSPVTVWLYSLSCTPEGEYLECKPLPNSPLLCSDKILQNISNIQYRASTVSTVFAQIAR